MRKMSDLVRDRRPLILSPAMTVQHACHRMRRGRAGAVLIASNDGRLKGIFTRGDAINRVVAEGKNPKETTLSEVMTTSLRTISPDATVIDALRIMQDCGCRHLPVVHSDRIVGIVFRGDFRGLELDRIEEEADLWERI
jgi:CBS domain-containing protein